MKSTTYSRLLVSLLALTSATAATLACGPYNRIIPTPEFMKSDGNTCNNYDPERIENLALWQSITSTDIPLSDIEQAVYTDTKKEFQRQATSEAKTTNRFYAYLKSHDDVEAIDFLLTAKQLEETRRAMQSPWYYPKTRSHQTPESELSQIISKCKSYTGARLADRYSLQIVRALFASRLYDQCIQFYDSAFANVPDDNLLKRMSSAYVAGCWINLGSNEKAESLRPDSRLPQSIAAGNAIEHIANVNPNTPQIIDYIRTKSSDSTFMAGILPVAEKLKEDQRIEARGDWYFICAYINNKYCANPAKAYDQIRTACSLKFSSDELKDFARAYKMKLAAQNFDKSTLLSDLKWIEATSKSPNRDKFQWERRLENIIYAEWVPQLWRGADYATAILLCSYADQININTLAEGILTKYSTLSFQMAYSLNSSQLATIHKDMSRSNPLYNYLRSKSQDDKDFYYELIGTIALREENYSRAKEYLSRVSIKYQKSMPIFAYGYLKRDPFINYPTRWEKSDPWSVYQWDSECRSSSKANETWTDVNAKLRFATQMLSLQKTMTSDPSSDQRALARIDYEIGRRNSFEECWALTQYWRGNCLLFSPNLEYFDDFPECNYSFLYDQERAFNHKATEKRFKKEVALAMASIQSDQTKAQAEYALGNLATVIHRYPNTPTASFIKTSCDNWKKWI